MNPHIYNNFGISVISIAAVLSHVNMMPISKITLIFPLISHQDLLSHLSRKNTVIPSIEKLIIDRTSYFANFDKRYYDSLCTTFNAIQYLNDMKYVEFVNSTIRVSKPLIYDKNMGKRADKIYKASFNIAEILNDTSEKLFLNLRVSL